MPLDSPNTSLESAIAAVTAAKARLDRIDELLRETEDKSHTARHRMRDMEDAFNEARKNESKNVVAALLDETVITKSVEDHERDFQQARGDYDRLRGLVLNLQREQQAGERALHDAEYARKIGVRAVMQSHPAVVAFYERYQQHYEQWKSMNGAGEIIFNAGGNPLGWGQFPVMEGRDPFDPRLRDQWQRAIQQLETTGECEFPED